MPSRTEAPPPAGGPTDYPGLREVRAVRVSAGAAEDIAGKVAEETPVALICNGEPHVVMLATPRDLEDFAVGFALSEGLVPRAADISYLDITPCPQGVQVHLRFKEVTGGRAAGRPRNLAGRTGCGLCGTAMIEDAVRETPVVAADVEVPMTGLAAGLAALRSHQPLNAETGAVHAAAWVNLEGEILLLREDVGRHNALDKLIGALYRDGTYSLGAGFTIVTSRASYEMVTKSAFAGIAVLAAISAPTALAIRIAEKSRITLAGFARDRACVVYSHPARIRWSPP